MARSIEQDATVFATLSGAMTPAGLHQSCIVPMIENGLVDVLTTTGANLYHDAHRVIGHRVHEIRPDAGDRALRDARITRSTISASRRGCSSIRMPCSQRS